jgi:hypothetical protein
MGTGAEGARQLQASQAGHADVQEGDIRLQRARQPQCFVAVGRFSHQFRFRPQCCQ